MANFEHVFELRGHFFNQIVLGLIVLAGEFLEFYKGTWIDFWDYKGCEEHDCEGRDEDQI